MPTSVHRMHAGLETFLSERVGEAVTVIDLAPVSSVGNARDPWVFTACWKGAEKRCVMLVKAAAGQLETELASEFHTVAALAGSGVPVPAALWLDETGAAFGEPFFVTQWVPGSADTKMLRRAPEAATVRAVALDLAAAAARLHAVAPQPFEAHLPSTTVVSAASTQLDAWHDTFRRHRLEPHPALVYAFAWLAHRPPVATRLSVVHGDLRFGNLLHHHGRLTALLDWEMAHLGDPVEDLGWVYRALWTPHAALPWTEFLTAYHAAGGGPVDPSHLRWYQVFAEVKHSVISLTATKSFVDGTTASLRHADRAATVPPFLRRLLELLSQPC